MFRLVVLPAENETEHHDHHDQHGRVVLATAAGLIGILELCQVNSYTFGPSQEAGPAYLYDKWGNEELPLSLVTELDRARLWQTDGSVADGAGPSSFRAANRTETQRRRHTHCTSADSGTA